MKEILHLVVAAAVISLLAGCRTTAPKMAKGPLTPEEVQAVQTGKKTIVLFRVTTTESGTQETSDYLDRARWNIWGVHNWKQIQHLAGPSIKSTPYWRMPPETSRQDGWRYLVLEPGRYFIEARPSASVITFPIYHLSVPSGSRIAYAGTFAFTNSINTNSLFVPCGVRNETEAARNVMKPLASLGPLTTSLAVPGDLAALRSYPSPKISSVEASNCPPHPTKYIGRQAGSMLAAPFLLSGWALLALLGSDNDDGPTYYAEKKTRPEDEALGDVFIFGGAISLFAVSVPIAALGQVTVAPVVRMTWKPHEAALEQEMVRYDLAGRLTNSVLQKIINSPAGLNDTNSTGVAVRIGVYRLGIDPTDRFGSGYNFDTAAYLAVIDPVSGDVLWEHGYVYGHQKYEKRIYPFTTFVSYGGETLSPGDYKGKTGLQHLDVQLDDVVRLFGEKMSSDLKAAGF